MNSHGKLLQSGRETISRKKSTLSFVPCVSARPQSGEGQLLSQGRSQHLPWCLVSAPTPEWRETAAQPRKKSTPSLVSCVSARPQSGEGQLLSQGRSQHLPWCLVSAPAPRVERDSCSAKEEVNTFLGALCQHPPQSGERQLLSQGRSQHLPWCLVSAPAPRVERASCSAKEEVNTFIGALCQHPPQRGERQLLSKGRSQHLPWCLVSAPAPRVERASCSAKEEVNTFLGALCQHPPQRGERQLLSQGRSQHLPWCLVSAPAPRVERANCSAKEETHIKSIVP